MLIMLEKQETDRQDRERDDPGSTADQAREVQREFERQDQAPPTYEWTTFPPPLPSGLERPQE